MLHLQVFEAYAFLKGLRHKVHGVLQSGKAGCEVYEIARGEVLKHCPKLWPHFVKSLGHSIG